MAYVTQMQLIERFLAKGAAAAMTLEQFIKAMIDEWDNSKELELMLTGQRYYVSIHASAREATITRKCLNIQAF